MTAILQPAGACRVTRAPGLTGDSLGDWGYLGDWDYLGDGDSAGDWDPVGVLDPPGNGAAIEPRRLQQ